MPKSILHWPFRQALLPKEAECIFFCKLLSLRRRPVSPKTIRFLTIFLYITTCRIMNNLKRNQFLRLLCTGGIGLAAAKIPVAAFQQDEPPLDKALVQEFVGAGHRDMDKVKELLAAHPTLLNAAHDWKGGDFETCLGAASHVGYKELALWLIEQGAQANIFTACLFGQIDIVRPMLDFFPACLHAKGPHGFTLLHHAQRGGDEALEVKEYLGSLGAKETKVPLF